jgi:DNA-binding transcriptional LysR family regulator
MQITQVRYFLAVCQERNFTRAARRCGVAQPTVTNSIQALERELGAALFHRKPPGELTARGQALYPYLRRIVEAVDLALLAAGNGPVRSSKARNTRASVRGSPHHGRRRLGNPAAKTATLNIGEQCERQSDRDGCPGAGMPQRDLDE